MSGISATRKQFIHATLSPMTLMFPSPSWKYLHDYIKTNEDLLDKNVEISASEDKNTLDTNGNALDSESAEFFSPENRWKPRYSDPDVDLNMSNVMDMPPAHETIHEINIEVGKSAQIDGPEKKLKKLIETDSIKDDFSVEMVWNFVNISAVILFVFLMFKIIDHYSE